MMDFSASEHLVIIRNSLFSDLFVGVEHNANLGAHGSRGHVLGESYADCTVVAVAGNNFAPFTFVIGTGLGVL